VGRFLIAYRDGFRLFTPLPVEQIRQTNQVVLNLRFPATTTAEPVLFTHGEIGNSGGEGVVVLAAVTDIPGLELEYE
jgi:hypothetical protein